MKLSKKKTAISSEPDNFIDYNLDKNSLKKIKDDTERIALINALKAANGDSLKAAKKLGISLRSFYYKIKKYNIKKIYEYKWRAISQFSNCPIHRFIRARQSPFEIAFPLIIDKNLHNVQIYAIICKRK